LQKYTFFLITIYFDFFKKRQAPQVLLHNDTTLAVILQISPSEIHPEHLSHNLSESFQHLYGKIYRTDN